MEAVLIITALALASWLSFRAGVKWTVLYMEDKAFDSEKYYNDIDAQLRYASREAGKDEQ
jgi:hypothetical protein